MFTKYTKKIDEIAQTLNRKLTELKETTTTTGELEMAYDDIDDQIERLEAITDIKQSNPPDDQPNNDKNKKWLPK